MRGGARVAAAVPERAIRILELRSVRGTGGGPEKTILRGAARTDPARFAVTVCYIRDRRDDVFALEGLAASLAVDYVEIPERHSFDPAVWPPLRRLVRDRHIDIVHAHEYKTDLLALMLARAEGIIPLSTAHGWTGHSRRERHLYYPADRWILRRFPRVIAVSGEIRARLIAAGTDSARVSTVLNGIDPAMFRRQAGRRAVARASLGLDESAVVVGSIGRLEPQKRFDLLIEAVAQLRATRPGLRLVIAGDGSLGAELSALAGRCGLADRCMLAGHRPDVVDVLHAFDLFVQSSDYEGTPNAVLEAMAVETPVVATSAGGTAELIEDCTHGLIVAPGNLPALVAGIERALDEKEATARRVLAARRRVEDELSFEARMKAVEKIYGELIQVRDPAVRLSAMAS